MFTVKNKKITSDKTLDIGKSRIINLVFKSDLDFVDDDKFKLFLGDIQSENFAFANDGYVRFSYVDLTEIIKKTSTDLSVKVACNGYQILSDSITITAQIIGGVIADEQPKTSFKLVAVTDYQQEQQQHEELTSIIISGITYDPNMDMWDMSVMNGRYQLTNATKDKSPSERVYKNTANNYCIGIYDDSESWMINGVQNWTVYSSEYAKPPTYIGDIFCQVGNDEFPLTGWQSYMGMFPNGLSFSIEKTTFPYQAENKTYKQISNYDKENKKFVLSDNTGVYVDYDVIPLKGQAYLLYEDSLMGKSVGYVDGILEVKEDMVINNAGTLIIDFADRKYYKQNNGWAICGFANFGGWNLPFMVGKTADSAKIGGSYDNSYDTGNPKSFEYKDGQIYYISGSDNSPGNHNNISFILPNVYLIQQKFQNVSDTYVQIGSAILDYYYGYN